MARPPVRIEPPQLDLTSAFAESGVHGVEYSIGWTAWVDVAAPGVEDVADVVTGSIHEDATVLVFERLRG